MSVREAAVIADDLTGAADCGIAFAAAGLSTFVVLGREDAPVADQVVAIDTDSRPLAPAEAAARTHAAGIRAYRDGARVIYKKLDSTLRGNVGVELAATLRAAADAGAGRALAILAPAFPATGRTTREGRVLVNGVPLDRTEVWRDSGMSGSAEPAAMLAAAGLRAANVPLAEVRAGIDALVRTLERIGGHADAVVCDALEEEDLRSIASAGARLARSVVWAGSGGLARHLPAALGLRRDPARATPRPRPARGSVLVLVGSRSSIAREQARRLEAEPGVVRVELDPQSLLRGERECGGPGAALEAALESGRDVLVAVGEHPMGLERANELAAAAGRLVAPHAARLAGVAVTGGDMARALLAALGAPGLHLLGEVEPGVPLGVVDVAPRGGVDVATTLPVATKAGAFGSPETLVRCLAALRPSGVRDKQAT